MATRLDGAGMIDARAGCAMAAPATIPAAPRNSLREQCNFIIGVNSRRFFSSMNRNRSGVSKFIFLSHNSRRSAHQCESAVLEGATSKVASWLASELPPIQTV